jgi:hypothetical protein
VHGCDLLGFVEVGVVDGDGRGPGHAEADFVVVEHPDEVVEVRGGARA